MSSGVRARSQNCIPYSMVVIFDKIAPFQSHRLLSEPGRTCFSAGRDTGRTWLSTCER